MRKMLINLVCRSLLTLWYTLLLLSYASAAYAATPIIVTGFLNLLNDATSWLLGMVPGGAAVMIGYHALMKMFAGGEQVEVAHHSRSMFKVLKAGAIGTGAVGFTKAILSYFI